MKKGENDIEIRKEKIEDEVFYAPLDVIISFEKILFNLEATRRELINVIEGMVPVEN
jgi:hypothetical protein